MKKTFRSILAGALALLTVSCYDDSALREQISGLDERVTAIENTLNKDVDGINDLASRLADAEDALAAANASLTSAQGSIAEILEALDAYDGQVDGLVSQFEKAIEDLGKADSDLAKAITDGDNALAAALLEGKTELAKQLAAVVAKVAVVKVEEVGGNVVLTLADASTVTLSKPLSNVDNSGLVTVDENGNWAVVKADGTLESLNVPVGHPDVKIQFQVADNGDLQYAVNGGEWTATGVNTADVSGQAYVINGVEVADDNSNVAITIGETVYTLPLYVAKTVVFEISRESMYVGYGTSKKFTVETEGINGFYVANKPDGWKVSVDGNEVTVLAPSKNLVELGACELEGQIVLHADADVCKYVSLEVSTGEVFSIKVDSATGEVTFFNAMANVYEDPDGLYPPEYGFADATIGILPVSDFEGLTVDELLESAEYWAIPASYLQTVKDNAEITSTYIPGEYEEDVFKINIAELGQYFYPQAEIVEGVQYVVWAVPQTDAVHKELFTTAVYKPIKVAPTATTVAFNDIVFDLEAYGATSYVAMAYDAAMFEYMTLEDYLVLGDVMPGAWTQFVRTGDLEALGFEIEPGEFRLSEIYFGSVLPTTKYLVAIFPYDETKPLSEYDFKKDYMPYVYEFTTGALVEDASLEAAFEEDVTKTTYTQVGVKITPVEGTSVYYRYYTPGEMDEATDDEIISDLFEWCYSPLTSEAVKTSSVSKPGDSKELIAVAISEDGKYAITREVFYSIELPYDSTIKASLESLTKTEAGEYTAVFNVAGASKFVIYLYSRNSAGSFATAIMNNGVAMDAFLYSFTSCNNSRIIRTSLYARTTYLC